VCESLTTTVQGEPARQAERLSTFSSSSASRSSLGRGAVLLQGNAIANRSTEHQCLSPENQSSRPSSRPDRRRSDKVQRRRRHNAAEHSPARPAVPRRRSTARHLADAPSCLHRRRHRVGRHERRPQADAAGRAVDAGRRHREVAVVRRVGRVARERGEAGRGRVGREGEADRGRRRAVDRVDVLEEGGADLRELVRQSSSTTYIYLARIDDRRARQKQESERADARPS